ncbi:MAG TPA: hypothetical protein DEA96_11610 [Leptospiraceae bacterium]|nr:hypothetical protein [Spirochaetaceae bacterium]HBS05607.1 hypothetical protein [Leptospiraceae bacterium]|tara:strand:+ start:348 stop:824 length:477 start_codon:yes stop_codon:yes gene_type:complete
MPAISGEMVQLFHGPVMVAICTVNSQKEPFFTRGWGTRAKTGESTLECFIPETLAGKPLSDLQENPLLAVNSVDATNFQGFQFKGRFLRSEKATPEEEEWLKKQRANASQVIAQFFGPSAGEGWARYIITPSIKLTMEVDEIFNQAPGAMTAEERKVL